MEGSAKRYTIFHAPVLSFFSKPFYQDVAWRWKGTNLLYLFLLLALTWLPPLLKMQWGLSRFLADESATVLDQIPPVHIRDGKLSIEAPEPHVIMLPESGKPLIVVDTTGEHTSLDDSEAHVLVTESKLYTRNSPHEIRTYDLSQIKRFDLDKARVKGWVGVFRRWFFIVAFPVLLVGSYVYRILQALVYGLIGLAFASSLRAKLGYDACIRLAVIAVTPVLLLDTARGLLHLSIPMWWLLCLAIAILYLFLGVKFAADRPPEPEEDEIAEAAVVG